MFRWANRHTYVLLLPAFLLAGCATGYHRNIHNVPDWEAEDSANAPSEIATPPTVASGSRGVAPLQDPQAPVASAPAALVQPPSPIQTNIAPAAPISSPSKPVISKPPEPTPTWVQLGRWCKEHNLPPPRASLFGNQPTFSITTAGGVFTLHLGTTVATWQGVQLWLGFVPRLIDGQPALHALDVQKNLAPLSLSTNAMSVAQQRVIVIDPGHGGENGGTRSVIGRGLEKDYTLDWAQRLVPLLQAHGWTVLLTRTNDTDLALSNRVAFAEQHRADLFVSLHFNSSAPDETQFGLETYCLPPAGMPSGVTRSFSDEITVTFPNNAFDQENLELAMRVHRALLGVNGGHDRGVRRARFPGVLRNQHRPAILVEGGYLSNRGEAVLIATASYRQKLAESLALAIGSAETRVAQASDNRAAATSAAASASTPLILPAIVSPPPPAPAATSKSALYDEP